MQIILAESLKNKSECIQNVSIPYIILLHVYFSTTLCSIQAAATATPNLLTNEWTELFPSQKKKKKSLSTLHIKMTFEF